MPEPDIDRRAGGTQLTARTATIPDRQQLRLCIQRLSALTRQADPQPARVSKQVFVTEIGIVSCEGPGASSPEAAFKPLHPGSSSRSNRNLAKLVEAKREHEFEIGTAFQQRLGDDDIGSG